MESFLAKMEQCKQEREDLTTPSKLTAGYILSNFGTDLDAIEPFTTELTGIVDKMKEELANEGRILEGTDVPEYGEGDWAPLQVPEMTSKVALQNELSRSESKEDQWKSSSLFGLSITAHTPTSIPGLSTSSCSARHNSPVSDILGSARCSCPLQTPSWQGTWGDCGCATDAMNESSECTVPTISEPTPGTPSEAK